VYLYIIYIYIYIYMYFWENSWVKSQRSISNHDHILLFYNLVNYIYIYIVHKVVVYIYTIYIQCIYHVTLYSSGSQMGVHVPLGVCEGTPGGT